MKSIRATFVNIRRTPYKSLATILMLSLTFFMVYGFSLFLLGSHQVVQFFETRPKVFAFFELKAEQDDIAEVVTALEQSDYIYDMTLVSSEEAFQYYQDIQQNPLLLELVTAEILPASIEVAATSPENLTLVSQQLKQFSQIEEIVAHQEVVEQLSDWVSFLRIVGLIIIGVLAVISLVIIINTISLKVSSHKKKVSILRFIGADSSYIIIPYIYEGFIYGLIGSIIGWGLVCSGLLYLTPMLKTFVGEIISFPLSWEFLLLQLAVGTSLALIFSGLGSLIAVKNLIKR